MGPTAQRRHVRRMRGAEIAETPEAVEAFIIDGVEVRPMRSRFRCNGPVFSKIDRFGSTAWTLENGLIHTVASSDMVKVLIQMSSAEYDVVTLAAA
jgi:hypothetical protein